jgi:2-hydroxymuconate-semialdehyde hydrolase
VMPFERSRIRVSAGELACVDVGEGPPVLLLHGFPTSSLLWRREAMFFASRMRVIVPDLLGYGESDKPRGADLSEPAQAGYARDLLRSLGIDELAIVGHDIGGVVAQLLALDEGGPRVKALVLLDSPSFDAWPIEGVRLIQGAAPEQETTQFVEDLIRLTFDLGMAHRERLDEATMQAYARPWRDEPAAFFRAARGIEGKGLSGRDGELAALDLPTLILWGEEDPFLGVELADRLQESIPGSTLALLPGCSHFVGEDAPQTIGPLILEFLRARYLGDAGGHGHSHGANGPVRVFLERPPPTSEGRA